MLNRLPFHKALLTLVIAASFITLAAGLFVYFNGDNAVAVSATDFKAGRIIDDSVFYNKDTMNVQEIQAFLDRQIPNCDTWGTGLSEYGGGTRAQYAASQGWHGPPYICLNKYHENPSTGETSYEKGGDEFDGGLSSAQIIYDAAQKYNINPQVLLVLLKKESAGPLTADTWPLKSQYKYAMGYACPDSGPGYSANCDDTKAGLYKQLDLSAWQLKYYKDHPNDYRYKVGWNDIQYSPDPACGTKRVYIENMATLSLYIYTPYTPNDTALANYPGTSICGAYGNRNFFMFFNEWFGSTYTPTYSATYESVENYTDNLKATHARADILVANSKTYMTLKFKNTGSTAWRNSGPGAVRLATLNTPNSPFCDSTWISCQRPAELKEPVVNPGEIGTFEFWYKAPNISVDTSYQTRFGVISEAVATMGGTQQVQTTLVQKANFNAAYQSVENYTDTSKSTGTPATPLNPGRKTYMVLRFKNNGNVIWRNSGPGAVRLATFGGNSPFCDETWISCQRPAEMKESDIAPGQIATFEFWYAAPSPQAATSYQTKFGVISEAVATMGGTQQVQTTLVQKAIYDAVYQNVENHTDTSKTVSIPANPMTSAQKTYMTLTFKNTGSTTWRNSGPGAVRLATFGGNSQFCDTTWISCQRPAELKEQVVNPGEVGTFEFWYEAPSVGVDTSYQTRFGVISEAVATMGGTQQVQTTLVHP